MNTKKPKSAFEVDILKFADELSDKRVSIQTLPLNNFKRKIILGLAYIKEWLSHEQKVVKFLCIREHTRLALASNRIKII